VASDLIICGSLLPWADRPHPPSQQHMGEHVPNLGSILRWSTLELPGRNTGNVVFQHAARPPPHLPFTVGQSFLNHRVHWVIRPPGPHVLKGPSGAPGIWPLCGQAQVYEVTLKKAGVTGASRLHVA
jgi:hypothetical protein